MKYTNWEIVVDRFEKKVRQYLPPLAAPYGIKIGSKKPGDTPDGDFIIKYDGKVVMAFERKAWMDCYSSIISGRIDNQIARLCTMFPAVGFILEESYIPKLRTPKYRIKQMVHTKASELSFRVPCLYSTGAEHTAYLLVRMITEGYLQIPTAKIVAKPAPNPTV